MRYTKDFKDISKEDVLLAGGKGASLGEMTQAGIPVPPGFVVLSSAFDAFLAETDMGGEIATVLDTVNTVEMHTVEHASEKIQALILNASMPVGIADEIMSAHTQLGAEFVAVRSSATAEDSASAAWAGQLDSFLNTTQETLLQNIQKCWASLFTPRAIFYGFEKGFYKSGKGKVEREKCGLGISVAVVVQAMVQSEVSGIAFSVHPVTQDTNQLIIEAGYGLGEAIVSGQITPDSYVVTKSPLEIIDKNVSTQDRMLIRSKDGGNEWVSTSVIPAHAGIQSTSGSNTGSPGLEDSPEDDKVGDSQKLSDSQILALSRLIIKIENHYGFPCDIEWAWVSSPVIPVSTSESASARRPESSSGKFYITQSRPITTLSVESGASVPKYEKFFSRDFCLASVQAWVRGESINPKSWTEEVQPYLPYIVTERADDTVHFWYDVRGVEWVRNVLVDLARSDKTFLKKIEQGVQKSLSYIRPIYEQEKILSLDELKRFVQELEAGYPWFEAMWWYCQMDSSKLVGLDIYDMQKVRELTDTLCNASDTVIRKSLLNAYPALGDLVGVVSIEEIMNGVIPDSTVLAKRDSGYYYGNGELLVDIQSEEVARRFKIDFHIEHAEKDVQRISGVAAMKGVVRGFVRRVMGHKQIGDVHEGEILVTPMTIPDFMPAMLKAVAFITDEGGITCHAAISARELQKPCIVGTKIATQVLHDGDLVEVDANTGVVRILERAK